MSPSVGFSQLLSFASLCFIPFLRTQGFAHMMAEQGTALSLQHVSSVDLHGFVLSIYRSA